MKKLAIALTLSASIFGLAACSNDSGSGKGDPETIATSKAGDIKKEDFYNEMKQRSGNDVLKEMVTAKVLEDKYKVTDKQVNDELQKIKDQLGDGYKQALQQQGFTEKQLKENLRLNLLQEQAVTEDIKVKDADIKKQYDRMKTELKASHILVDDKKTAEKVKKELDAGGDFAELAKKYSKDDANKDKGGELGWFSAKDNMDEAFLNAAYKMKKGEVSDPVQSSFGYHIIKLEDKRENKDVESYDKAKKDIRRELAMKKIDPVKAQEKLDKLVKEADVKIKVKDLKDALKQDDSQQTIPQG
ncbi:peptidylprolyl isomerase [Aciduricibacillus chroicocephali]|uniref:Foldase protein PrsA n=1 Tax=Aciduricibacillus chroicocephali TaxID=3054939 RepID=A0ABY9KYN4_9BACI|nr:peptidylprolyl isomerase [Bacillaceae bacterium 44XB]